MFKRNWLFVAAFAGLTFAASPLAAQQSGDGGSAEGDTRQAGQTPNNSPAVAAAIDRLADEIAETRVEQSDPYGEERNQREQRDILAQEEMAYWAWAMFWAMVAQTFLALCALIALLLDLRQNRKSSEAQIRAYLSVEPLTLRLNGNTGEYEVQISILNQGQSPAFRVKTAASFYVGKMEPAEAEIMRSEPRPEIGRAALCTIQIARDIKSSFQSPQNLNKGQIAALRNGNIHLFIFGFVSYVDAFNQLRETKFCYFQENLPLPPQDGIFARTDSEWEIAPFHNETT